MNPLIALIPVSVAIAACSQALVPQRSRVASGEIVTCRDVTPTGSHLPRRVCTSAAERERQQEAARAVLDDHRGYPPVGERTRPGVIRDTTRP